MVGKKQYNRKDNNQGQQQAQPQQPAPDELSRIKARKKWVIDTFQKWCADPLWNERLMKVVNNDASKVMRALNSFCTFILNDQGSGWGDSPKKYLCDANVGSLFQCFLEAFGIGLEIGGGRDLCAVMVYGGTAELEVTYKGFANALSKHYRNSFVQVDKIFEGDDFIANVSGATATFNHVPKNLLSQTWDKIKGAYCYFEYTQQSGKEVSRLVVIDRKEIETIRSKAKSQKVWNEWNGEMIIKAVIRRASKIPFAQIDFDLEFEDPAVVDNKHFMLEDMSGENRLSKLMQKQQELMTSDDKPVTDNKPEPSGDKPVDDATRFPDDKPPAQTVQENGENVQNSGNSVAGANIDASHAELSDADFEEVQP
jgi:recombinational DNA repair protein RecT